MIFTEHTSASYGTYLALPIHLPSWKPGFETHLFHTTANEFRLMHSLPRRQMNHGYCPNFHDGKQITRTASFPECVSYPLERPDWITLLKQFFQLASFRKNTFNNSF
ncbi:hypothetical protein BD560DRAFT_429577 [Blakeslea trispora]|nr:hypothetical protein BD560DRAFT_429577 [Blakeslea trispora]